MNALHHFNISLSELKEKSHKYGRISDSNSKLDEISKLLAIQLFELKYNPKSTWIEDILEKFKLDSEGLVSVLKAKFCEISISEIYFTNNKENIFGNNPALNIDNSDNEFAYSLINLIHLNFKLTNSKKEKFDFLNEAFGYFIRDNFRNNIEDAQYMTPQEVVDLMCNIGYKESIKDVNNFKNDKFLVCDPCCGVGSFLVSFYKLYKENKIGTAQIRLIGQDKVQRMARLTKLNLNFLQESNHDVFIGNSLSGKSDLDKYLGKIDLILTNPPFGARFSKSELLNEPKSNYPLLYDVIKSSTAINSEILFVDRCLSLLKEGGHLLAVLPDSVISSKGIAEILRYRLINNTEYTLKSIIELPTVTFAQAGTRTKTSILHIQKAKNNNKLVFIAKSDMIGFEVSKRKGTTLKINSGDNDLVKIFNCYSEIEKPRSTVLNNCPSVTLIPYENFKNNPWTPNHYNANKVEILEHLKNHLNYELVRLEDLANFVTTRRKKEIHKPESKCISVLHVINGDLLDIDELIKYFPKYTGIVCQAGDLIFSKINPRIQRLLVIPELKWDLTCSSEFEILNSKCELSNYELKTLLMLPQVKIQINHLTSGTSSSHNRIKTNELKNLLIPLPRKGSYLEKDFNEYLKKSEEIYKKSLNYNIQKSIITSQLESLIEN